MNAYIASGQDDIRHAAQETIGITFYPGTELMTDVGNVHLKHGGKQTLVPQPSDDPADPVNWSRTWKWLTMSSMAFTTFNWVFSPLALAPQVPYYMKSFDSTLPEVINFIGVSILVLGFTNLIWVPFARGFGRRPMAIVTTLITTASCIWRATAKDYNSFLGASILCGIGASPGETLGPVMIADVMFLHDRGWWMGLYQWVFWSGLMIGPIIAGVTADRDSWRTFWWISTGFSIFTNIWILFFFPETKWDRRGVSAGLTVAAPTEISADRTLQRTASAPEKTTSTHTEDRENNPSLDGDQLSVKLSGKPTRKQLMPIVAWNSHEPILEAITLPFKLIRFPIVLWGALQFTCSASCFLMVNITQSQALGAPPYNFTPAVVGYCNLALFVGTCISLLTAGPLSDWISRRATTKNGGVREPEMRLPALLPFSIFFVIGSIVLCVGFQYQWPWEAIVIIGFGLIGIQVAAISGISINYVVDCYKPAAGEFLVGATVIKNVWGYGMTKFLNDWVVQIGYIGPLMFIAALNLACLVFGALPLYIYGKNVRGWSAKSSVHRVS